VTFDPLAAMAVTDVEKLNEVMEGINSDSDRMNEVLSEVSRREGLVSFDDIDYDELWQGMPEFEQDNLKPYKTIVVHFGSLKAVKEFQSLINQSFSEKTKYIWHPKQIRERYGKVE